MPVVKPKSVAAAESSSTSASSSKTSEMRGYKLTADGRKVNDFG
jgi:hypothetical protein